MLRLAWLSLVGLTLVLAVSVLVLDRQQARRGLPSVLGLPWEAGRDRDAAEPAPSRVPASEPPEAPEPRRDPTGRVGLIVDRLGSRLDVFERLVALRRPVAVAVLPGLPHSRRIAREARDAGLEVLLQLPLEPYRSLGPGSGPETLSISMTPEEVARRAREYLQSVPGIVGVVTHMGSRFTEDRARMRVVLEAVGREQLYFVDSLTTQRSVGYDLAHALGLRAGRRQVLIDPGEREATGRARLGDVARWATRRGSVIAIGRGLLLTVRLLEETLPRWEARGLRLVPVSALLDPPPLAARRARGRAPQGILEVEDLGCGRAGDRDVV